VIVNHFSSFKKEDYVKEFIKELSSFIGTPTIRAFLESRYEGKLRDIPSETKPTYENELELKNWFSQLINLLTNSV
jgi:hypothetical protein